MTQGSLVRVLHVLAVMASINHSSIAYANSDPRLEWDPSFDPNIVGYRVYQGESSQNYTHFVDVGLQTSVPLTNLSAGVTHYLAVTAYDGNQIESPMSEEVWYTPRVDGIRSELLRFNFAVGPDLTALEFNAHAGQQCRVLVSTDLSEWHAVQTENFSRDEMGTYYEVGSASHSKRFFRVVATPPWHANGPLPFTLTTSPSVSTIEFVGRAGQRCRILASFDMNNWQEIYSVTPDGITPVVFYDAGSEVHPMRFYRVVTGAH